MGIQIALDDFGTGYSSLTSLSTFDIDILKIDGSLIKNIEKDLTCTVITRHIVRMAQELDIKLVAERVETWDQLTFLRELKCYSGQGHIYSRPVPPEEFVEVLARKECTPVISDGITVHGERRKFFRIKFPRLLETDLTILEIKGRKVNVGNTKVLVKNIGPGGLCFISNIRLPVDENVILQFRTYLIGEEVRVYGCKAHPTIDGQPTLGFEVHSQDWRSFCLTNAPQHLIGGRNEGDVVVHPDTLKVEIYQNKWYAKEYYKKLNEVFKKGLIHPETFSRNYDNYLSVISTGRVLGMFDQQWNFQDGESVLVSEGKIERTYVPLGISLDGSDVPYNRVRSEGIIGGNGMGISVKCKDIERALQFMDTLLEEDVHRLMYWGIEGEDYYVDENGRYRRTPEQKANFDNPDWRLANSGAVIGDQFPKLEGRYSNGNSCGAGTQPEERLENQFPYDKEFYSKYGFYSKSDFLPLMVHPGYPEVWSIFSTMEEDNIAKPIFDEITDLQNRYLPGVIMSDNFDAAWDEYVARYENVNYKALEEEIERQIQARLTKR